MSTLYISSAGISVSRNKGIWDEAREAFEYDESIVFCSPYVKNEVLKFADKNTNLVMIKNPYNTMEGFTEAVVDLLKQARDIIEFYKKKGKEIEEIIVNSSGGTEKMSLILNELMPFLRDIHPNVTQVWSSNQGYKSIFTVKPRSEGMNIEEIVRKSMSGSYIPKSTTDIISDIEAPTLKQEDAMESFNKSVDTLVDTMQNNKYEDAPAPEEDNAEVKRSGGLFSSFLNVFYNGDKK